MTPRKKKTAANSGAFRRGPDPRRGVGKRGRSGRPKDIVRLACQVAFEKAVPVLVHIVHGRLPDVSTGDRIRAADVLGRYGGMQYTESDVHAEPVEVRVDLGQHERETRAWLVNELTAMTARVEQARAADVQPPAPTAPIPRANDGHDGTGNGHRLGYRLS